MSEPKLFVSYSWTNADHEDRVLQIATELRQSGVDVVLDKWHLREGQDSIAFMEKMVTDPAITKVVLVCDKMYAEKADRRTGGVGTEAQIISPEIYAQQDRNKFVAVITERDEDGRPYVPAYYRSRIHIDFTDPSAYSENFERLLRWIYDQPLHQAPELGPKPAFLSEEQRALQMTTSYRWKRAVDAIRNGREFANGAVDEYLSVLASEFEKLRLDPAADPFDEAVIRSIDSFVPYRNEALEVVSALALYRDGEDTRRLLHRWFERLIPYLRRPPAVDRWRERDFDNFKFLVHELFLLSIATLVRHERFETAAFLMATPYYAALEDRETLRSFTVFRQQVESLEQRNLRLNLRRLTLHGDLLVQRIAGTSLEVRHLLQADFVLFVHSHLHPSHGYFSGWWPQTLVYVGRLGGAFEIFARARSVAYFERIKLLLGIGSKEELISLADTLGKPPGTIPRWEGESFSVSHLLGLDQLATTP